jgi:hypothetical protein
MMEKILENDSATPQLAYGTDLTGATVLLEFKLAPSENRRDVLL